MVKPARPQTAVCAKTSIYRGAPGDYWHIIASGHPGKNNTTVLTHLRPTDDPISETSPFLGLESDYCTHSAAIRTAMLKFVRSIKVDATGEYWIDWLTLIFLAWLWQLTREKDRVFSEIKEGESVRYPFKTNRFEPEIKKVIDITFSTANAPMIIAGGIAQLRTLKLGKDEALLEVQLDFEGVRAAHVLQHAAGGFREYVWSLFRRHPLEIAISISLLHGAPPHPPLSEKMRQFMERDDVAMAERDLKDLRARLFRMGRLALVAPEEAQVIAQNCQPTSHPVNSAKLVADVRRKLEDARSSNELRQEQLATAGFMGKRLTFQSGDVLLTAIRAGGINLRSADAAQRKGLKAWLQQVDKVQPHLKLLCVTEDPDILINRSTMKVVNALRDGKLRVFMLPTVFKTTKDFWDLMKASDLCKGKEKLAFPVPKEEHWYDSDALIPIVPAAAKTTAVGIVCRASKPCLSWATLFHCWSAGFDTVFVAAQLSRAVEAQQIKHTFSPTIDLLSWGEFENTSLLRDPKRPSAVQTLPHLSTQELAELIAKQSQCADASVCADRLRELRQVHADAKGAACITRATIADCAPEGSPSTATRRGRTCHATLHDILRVCPENLVAPAQAVETPAVLNTFFQQPRGSSKRGFVWDRELGRYVRHRKRPKVYSGSKRNAPEPEHEE